jgi:hypothetical protein
VIFGGHCAVVDDVISLTGLHRRRPDSAGFNQGYLTVSRGPCAADALPDKKVAE